MGWKSFFIIFNIFTPFYKLFIDIFINIDKLKTHLEVAARKIVEECASTNSNVNASSNSINVNSNNRNSNSNNNNNDTIFGSIFSNMNMNINLSEYGDKMKKYYDGAHC